MKKNTICLWYDKDAEEAAHFYARTFPDSTVGAVQRAPSDFPGGKAGDVLTVEFTVFGVQCLGLNGGDVFKHSEAFSFQIATDDQAETDRYWNAIVGNGGAESVCGWCKDRWGLSWQITPRVLIEAMARGGDVAKRAFEAMMKMEKIDVAKIEAAVRGEDAPGERCASIPSTRLPSTVDTATRLRASRPSRSGFSTRGSRRAACTPTWPIRRRTRSTRQSGIARCVM